MIKIGITGSISSGKTTASKIISKGYGPLFSADKTVANLYKRKSFQKILTKIFNLQKKKNKSTALDLNNFIDHYENNKSRVVNKKKWEHFINFSELNYNFDTQEIIKVQLIELFPEICDPLADNMAENGLRRMKLRAPGFSGSKTQMVKQFFSRLEKYFIYNQIEQNGYIEALGLVLEGSALDAYDTIIRNNPNITFNENREALINRYDDRRIDIVIRS